MADLFASDWKARNRAAAALAQAPTVDEAALVAAMRRENGPSTTQWNSAVGLGGRTREENPVHDLRSEHRRQRPYRTGPYAARTPQSTKDLVVPFDSRLLAAFVLHVRDTQSLPYVEALLELVERAEDYEVGVSAASYAWKLRGEVSVARTLAIDESRAAERLASCAAEAGEVALREVVGGLRDGSGPVRAAILDRLDSRWVASQPELTTLALELLGSEATEVADAAAVLVRSAGLFERPEFAAALFDRKRAARATLVLLDEQKTPTALATPLVHVLLDATADAGARVRAAFVLQDLGPRLEREAPELARAAFEALATIYADAKVDSDLGLAVIAALGGYAKSMTPECEERLRKHASAWISRVRGGQFAALGALLDTQRIDAVPFAELEAHWKDQGRDGLFQRLVGAMLRRGSEAAPLLRANRRAMTWHVLADADLVPFAPTLRTWITDEDELVRAFAISNLARFGADSGFDEAAVLALGRSTAANGVDTPAANLLRNLLARIAREEASFDWLMQNWGGTRPTRDAAEAIARAPIPAEKRHALLVRVLARADARDWPVQALEVGALRSLAREVFANGGGECDALEVLVGLPSYEPEDEALFLAALRANCGSTVLEALRTQRRLPEGLRTTVEDLCTDESELGPGSAAVALLWATRDGAR